MGPRASQDLRSPCPIMAPALNENDLYFKANKSSNIGKNTTTNQCRGVPDLWRPGSVKLKRYYTKNGRLIPTAKRVKETKQP